MRQGVRRAVVGEVARLEQHRGQVAPPGRPRPPTSAATTPRPASARPDAGAVATGSDPRGRAGRLVASPELTGSVNPGPGPAVNHLSRDEPANGRAGPTSGDRCAQARRSVSVTVTVSPASLPIVRRTSAVTGSLWRPSPRAMNDVRTGTPSIVAATLTRPAGAEELGRPRPDEVGPAALGRALLERGLERDVEGAHPGAGRHFGADRRVDHAAALLGATSWAAR